MDAANDSEILARLLDQQCKQTLAEVEVVCNRFAVASEGRVQFAGLGAKGATLFREFIPGIPQFLRPL